MTQLTVCVECATTMTVVYRGQTRHPGCHACTRPSSTCPDCIAERRAHREQTAKRRAQQFRKRLEQA